MSINYFKEFCVKVSIDISQILRFDCKIIKQIIIINYSTICWYMEKDSTKINMVSLSKLTILLN